MLTRYDIAVHLLPPVIYESSVVSIRDINSSSFEQAEYALEEGTVVFVRSGGFAGSTGRNTFDLDANYVFFGGSHDYIYANANLGEASACTVIRYSGATFAAPALHEKLVLCSPSAYLSHARLVRALRAGSPAEALDNAALALVCDALTAVPNGDVRRYERTYMICAIKELVNQSLSKPVSLAALAKQFYLSPFAVSRAFHQETGISLRRYSQRLRLRKALMLMVEHEFRPGARLQTCKFLR
jgi:hypothetical protein